MAVVFFDIGDTLGSVTLTADASRVEALSVFPFVPPVLERLRASDIRLGIISNTGNETAESMKRILQQAGIYHLFDPQLLIYSSVVRMTKNSPAIFRLAVREAGLSEHPEYCVFVGEDAGERDYALQAGLRACPHPSLIFAVLKDNPLIYVRATAPASDAQKDWKGRLKNLPLVPLHVNGAGGKTIYAITDIKTACVLDDLRFSVDRLGAPGAPVRTQLYLLRDDRAQRTGFLNASGQSAEFLSRTNAVWHLLSSTAEGLFVAIPAEHSIQQYHLPEAYHGHTMKLIPDMSLLEPFGTAYSAAAAKRFLAEGVGRDLTGEEVAVLREIDDKAIARYLAPYVGKKAVDNTGQVFIKSRNIVNPGNSLAVGQLVRDLIEAGDGKLNVRLHQFTHEGRPLYNVEAELAGETTDEYVLVTAHLDSTGNFTPGYMPEIDPAPGADDDGSGIAATVAIASAIVKLSKLKRPRRTIRFVLFNAEEYGLIGSKVYARQQAAQIAQVAGVYQMDMVGYNVSAPRAFETHAGYWDVPDVQQRSVALAERIERYARAVAPALAPPQIYTSKGADQSQRDPAEGRSDHASFQQVGYAACVVSGDFFPGPQSDSPQPEPNPHYHKVSDNEIDAEFAADIARAIAAAAWITANS